MSITVSHITKTYGSQKAVDDVSFTIPQGQTCGFLGPNGAGKSTAMKIMTGFITPDEGEVFVNDINVAEQPNQAKQKIGYLPEHNPLYKTMYVREFLDFNAKLYKLSNRKEQVERSIELVGLNKESHKKIGALSKGYRQRVGLAQAIIHDPEVLILDEPLNGLDPNQLAEIRELIIALGREKTVLFSSHILQEVELVANRILMIQDGKLVHDSVNEKVEKSSIYIEFEKEPSQQLVNKLGELGQYILTGNEVTLTARGKEVRKKIFTLAQEQGNALLTLKEVKQDLTGLFKSKTGAE